MDSDPNRKPGSHPHPHGHKHQKPSNSELLSSAKLVAEATQSTFRHESHKVDKAKVAGAAGDILEAACHYGKLEEKSFGKYIDKAEDYLHNYSTSHSTAGKPEHLKPESHGVGGHSGDGFVKSDSHSDSYSSKPESHGHGGHSGSGGGFGDYMKLAQGFMKSDESSKLDSHGGGGGGHSGGGYGDYVKMAEGFLKKH